MKVYLYNKILGCHPKWTLAVTAVNQRDADNYVRGWHRSGKRAGEVESGYIHADCGGITQAAQEILAAQNAEMMRPDADTEGR